MMNCNDCGHPIDDCQCSLFGGRKKPTVNVGTEGHIDNQPMNNQDDRNNKAEALREKILWTISDEVLVKGGVLDSEREPLAKALASLCAEVAREAVESQKKVMSMCINTSYCHGNRDAIDEAIEAINKAFGVSDEP